MIKMGRGGDGSYVLTSGDKIAIGSNWWPVIGIPYLIGEWPMFLLGFVVGSTLTKVVLSCVT